MTVTRRLFTAALAGTAALALAGAAEAQQKPWRFGHQMPADHPLNQGVTKAAQEIAAKSGGRLKVDVFPSSQLGTGREMIDQVVAGTLEFIIDGPGTLSAWQRPLSILEAPFLARDWDHLVKIIDSPFGQEQFKQIAEKRGLQKVGVFYYGTRQLTTAKKAVEKLEDMKGLKIRVPEVPVYMDMIRAVGATPTPMAFAEVYLSLQTGVADGQENPLPTINSGKFFEVQKFLSLTSHIIVPQIVMINGKTWAGLNAADRKTVTDAFVEGAKVNDAAFRKLEGELVDQFKAKGMTVVQPNLEPFRAAMIPVYQKNEDNWGKGVFETLRNIR